MELCAHAHTNSYTHTHTHIHGIMHTNTHIHTRTHIHGNMHTNHTRLHIHGIVHTNTCTHMHTHIYMELCTQIGNRTSAPFAWDHKQQSTPLTNLHNHWYSTSQTRATLRPNYTRRQRPYSSLSVVILEKYVFK